MCKPKPPGHYSILYYLLSLCSCFPVLYYVHLHSVFWSVSFTVTYSHKIAVFTCWLLYWDCVVDAVRITTRVTKP